MSFCHKEGANIIYSRIKGQDSTQSKLAIYIYIYIYIYGIFYLGGGEGGRN